MTALNFCFKMIKSVATMVPLFWCVLQGVCPCFAAQSDAKNYSLKEILAEWQAKPMEQTVAAAEKGDLTAQHFLGYYHTEGVGGVTNYVEGRKWYLKAAELKFPNSLNNLGVIYQYGRGVTKDLAVAKKYFLLAADLGSDISKDNLARLLLYGGSRPDPEEAAEAMKWLKNASDGGFGKAQALYGYLLMYPVDGSKPDVEQAIHVLETAAAGGHWDAYRRLGNIYLDKKFPLMNEQTALHYFQAGADRGEASCQSSLGWAFFNGIGGKHSQEEAVQWLLKAADQKYIYAYHNLGRVYSGEDMSDPPKGFRPDFEKACEWFQKSANAGNGDSAFLHGKIICDGLIPWKSKADALPVLESAAKAGHHQSKDLLDVIKMDLAANTKDETKVWENLALFHNAEAMSRLARKYRLGYGAKSDPVRTFRYEAALHLLGHSSTDSILDQMNNFTGSYTKGADGKTTRIITVQEKRFTPIYQALEKALESEDAAYYQTQAKRYLKGGEMPEDIGEAAIWFHLAADAGDASAKEQAALLDAQMDEIQRATALAWVGWLKLYQKRLR